MTTTNPAGRLLEMLHRMMAVPKPDTLTCKQMWSKALEIPESDGVALTQGIAEALSLVKATKDAISVCEGIDIPLYMASFPALESILDINNLPNGWLNFRTQLSQPHVLLGLRFCEAHLRSISLETLIDSTTLNNLMADAIDAANSIGKDTSLPSDLRELLLEHLYSIQRAISAYRIRGGESIKHSVERALGGLVAHRNLFRGQEQSRGVVRFMSVVEKTAEVTEGIAVFARKGFSLVEVVKDGIKLLS